MKVLSLFDGMSCGRIALDRLGMPVETYYASEIDPYAMNVSAANYPDIIRLGDVRGVKGDDLPPIDLVLAGSPCQGFSFAGKKLAFDDPRSALFFEFVRVLEEVKPKYFLLENVKMKKEHQDIISNLLGVQPILINSALVSAQNRNRLYWTNIPNVSQPEDKGIGWGSIKQRNVDSRFYYSDKALKWIERHATRTGKTLRIWGDAEKCQMIEASHFKNYSSQRFFGIMDSKGLRYITPEECEMAQTVPLGYTAQVSNTQRYKMLGNGWTVDVVAHILSGLKNA